MESNEMWNSYTLGLIAMLLWGVAPVFAKIGLGNIDPLPALMLRSALITTILAGFVTLTGKWPTVVAAAGGRELLFIALEGICAALLGQMAYYYAIKYGEVGKASLMVAAAPLITLALTIGLLGEKITIWKLAGAGSILIGILLLRY